MGNLSPCALDKKELLLGYESVLIMVLFCDVDTIFALYYHPVRSKRRLPGSVARYTAFFCSMMAGIPFCYCSLMVLAKNSKQPVPNVGRAANMDYDEPNTAGLTTMIVSDFRPGPEDEL